MNVRLKFLVPVGALVLTSCVPTAGSGSLEITTYPPGCTVYVDGVVQPETTPCVIESLLKGEDNTHSLHLIREEYNINWDTTFVISGTDILEIERTFISSLTIVAIDSATLDSVNAKILLDDTSKYCTTPYTLNSIIAGPHLLTLVKDSFAIYNCTTTVRCNMNNPFTAEMSRESKKVLFISYPYGAEIWVNGTYSGKITTTTLNLPLGSNTVEVRLPPYEPFSCTINVFDEESPLPPMVEVDLTSDYGKINVNANLDGATVFLEDTSCGVTPLLIKDLEPGIYRLELRKNTSTWGRQVTIIKGKTEFIFGILPDPGSTNATRMRVVGNKREGENHVPKKQ